MLTVNKQSAYEMEVFDDSDFFFIPERDLKILKNISLFAFAVVVK
jgi:hypothetical protein